jgi:hypothetical protein
MLCYDTNKAFPGYQARCRPGIIAGRGHPWFQLSSYNIVIGIAIVDSSEVRLGCKYESELKRSSYRHIDGRLVLVFPLECDDATTLEEFSNPGPVDEV